MVPKSKQTESVSTEYLRQARIVWRELISIAKKLPKSRALTETQYICRAGYDLMQAPRRGRWNLRDDSSRKCPEAFLPE